MLRRKRNYPEEGFQMAPMIDMVFLLLVFFMCVSSMASADKSVKLDLPDAEKSRVPEDLSDRGTLSIDQNGQVYLGRTAVEDEAITEALEAWIRRKPDAQIVIRADRDTPFKHVKQVLQNCAQAGAFSIVYATYEK